MTRHGFTLAFILALPLLHRNFYGQNKLIIITLYIRHIAGRSRKRLANIIKLEIAFDVSSVKHSHSAPCIVFKHKWCIIITVRNNFVVCIDNFRIQSIGLYFCDLSFDNGFFAFCNNSIPNIFQFFYALACKLPLRIITYTHNMVNNIYSIINI